MNTSTEALSAWIGRSETLHDHLHPWPLQALAATLDHAPAAVAQGTVLPPLWHWLYFLPRHRQSEVGADGHPQRGGFLPPVPLPRRMWAGSQLEFRAPLRIGDAVQRRSTLADVSAKSGRSGELVFVVVGHEVRNAQGLALREEHDIVYRAAAQPGDAAPVPVRPPLDGQQSWSRVITPDDVLLFRYSALTFNGHRIHYDRRYVTEVEGYPGLIVHGPLIATLLMQALRKELPGARVAGFSFRAVAPLFDTAPFQVCGTPNADGGGATLWAQNSRGELAMQADVVFEQ